MKKEEDKKETKEETVKNNLEIIKNHIPNIIKEAEERKYKVIVKSAETLENYLNI